jgi:hypothetical protein
MGWLKSAIELIEKVPGLTGTAIVMTNEVQMKVVESELMLAVKASIGTGLSE